MIVKMGYDFCIDNLCTRFLGEIAFYLGDSPDVEVHIPYRGTDSCFH